MQRKPATDTATHCEGGVRPHIRVGRVFGILHAVFATAQSSLTGSILPTKMWGKSPCEVAESVIRRPQNTNSWTSSESECRDAVCLGVLRNCTDVHHPHLPLCSSVFCRGQGVGDSRNLGMSVIRLYVSSRSESHVSGCRSDHWFRVGASSFLEDMIVLLRQRNT